MLLLLIGLFVAGSHAITEEDIVVQYINVSMELVAAMNGTGADEAELHELAKDIVYHGENQREILKLYNTYMKDKNDTIKEAFTNNYANEKYIESVLEQEVPKTGSAQDLIAAVEEEVAKDIGEKKAKEVVELGIKQLRLLDKHHVGWLEKASKLFFSLIKHDEN
ncbi:hypothetical protein GCK32_005560 [Trichostrongylus colubriformis]|uniref:DUF148 domain-containing protein n=1 Tax=Trichostrongylus colubriformis TaxID=6319 RepID=A0AAN8FQI3_TRICO